MTEKNPTTKLHVPYPKLMTVNPLAGLRTIGFAVFNVLLGLSLTFIPGSFGPAIAAYIFNYHIWSIIFIVSGLALCYWFVTNNWKMMRVALFFLLCTKVFWEIAILVRLILDPTSPLLFVLWGHTTFSLFVLYVYFPILPTERRNG